MIRQLSFIFTIRRLLTIVLSFVFIIDVLVIPPTTLAIEANSITGDSSSTVDCSEDARDARNDLFAINNISGFYDPCSATCDTSTSGSLILDVAVDSSFTLGSDPSMRAVVLARQLMSDYGLTAAQASGIVGNFMHESGGPHVPPNINEGGKAGPPAFSGGYGWAQWTGPRQVSFIDYAIQSKLMGSRSDEATDAANYAYLTHELSTAYKVTIAKIKETNSAEAAAISFESTFEKAGKPLMSKRIGFANQLLAAIQNNTGIDVNSASTLSSTTTPSSCQANAFAASGDFTATVKAFAWEDGRRVKAQKDAYQEVIKNTKYGNDSAHKYGNDCGAFVYNLMVVSGFEPKYPTTNTDGQLAWLRNKENGWEEIYGVGKADTGALQPGDVGIRSGHVFVWIGTIDGFASKSAEAALTEKVAGGVAPTAILSSNSFSKPSGYTWFRKSSNTNV